MAAPKLVASRFMKEPLRRKLDVASAMAWEALVESHTEQALNFVHLLEPWEPVQESLPRYLQEMDLVEAMATAVRPRVLTRLEAEAEARGEAPAPEEPDDGDRDAWSILREPQRVVRDVMRRQRRNDDMDRVVMLALARAEENVIETHVENAIGYVALLEQQPLDRAVQYYLQAVRLAGGRAQAVFQRTMARLADVHL